VSENLLSIYLDEYEDTPWKALKYLIAGICYGGHVTDNMDRRLLDTYISQYFNEDAIITPHFKYNNLFNYIILGITKYIYINIINKDEIIINYNEHIGN